MMRVFRARTLGPNEQPPSHPAQGGPTVPAAHSALMSGGISPPTRAESCTQASPRVQVCDAVAGGSQQPDLRSRISRCRHSGGVRVRGLIELADSLAKAADGSEFCTPGHHGGHLLWLALQMLGSFEYAEAESVTAGNMRDSAMEMRGEEPRGYGYPAQSHDPATRSRAAAPRSSFAGTEGVGVAQVAEVAGHHV